jgi:hypothetical protein
MMLHFARAASAVFKRPPAQKRKTKPRPLTPMQLAAKALNVDKRNRPAKVKAPPPVKIDWSLYPIGEVPDTEVAKLAGVSHQAVARARKHLGIAAHRRGSK